MDDIDKWRFAVVIVNEWGVPKSTEYFTTLAQAKKYQAEWMNPMESSATLLSVKVIRRGY
jgi:hypothetical protein